MLLASHYNVSGKNPLPGKEPEKFSSRNPHPHGRDHSFDASLEIQKVFYVKGFERTDLPWVCLGVKEKDS